MESGFHLSLRFLDGIYSDAIYRASYCSGRSPDRFVAVSLSINRAFGGRKLHGAAVGSMAYKAPLAVQILRPVACVVACKVAST